MVQFRLSLSDVIEDIGAFEPKQLVAMGKQAIVELQRQNSMWPVDSAKSKYGFGYLVTGSDVLLGNTRSYAFYVEAGKHQAGGTVTPRMRRNRGAAQRTLSRAPARTRLLRAAIKGRPSEDPAAQRAKRQAREEKDERIILEGEPDSGLSRDGKKRERARRSKNYRNRRTYRLTRVLNDKSTVRPWKRLTGAEINVVARLANALRRDILTSPELVLAQAIGSRKINRSRSSTILGIARTLNSLSVL